MRHIIVFLNTGTVTWASPDGSQERPQRVKAGERIQADAEVSHFDTEIIDDTGWTLLMPNDNILLLPSTDIGEHDIENDVTLAKLMRKSKLWHPRFEYNDEQISNLRTELKQFMQERNIVDGFEGWEAFVKYHKVPPIQRQLQEALGLEDADFAYHETDLYVVNKPGVYDWLKKNHKFYTNVQFFTSQEGSLWNGAGKLCLDIPFGGFWQRTR